MDDAVTTNDVTTSDWEAWRQQAEQAVETARTAGQDADERDERVLTLVAALNTADPAAAETCDMRQQEPYDFAWCLTHDTTFALGEVCKFNGRRMWEVYADEADQQRQRAVMAELNAEQVEFESEQLRARLVEAERVLSYALQLRARGEHAPGGNETWQEFDKLCEDWLRSTGA